MIGIAISAMILSASATNNDKLAAAEKTSQALATARDALMSFGVSVADSARLGDLPCPATNYATGIAAGSCNTLTTRIGYLPWNTLGLPDLRDGTGAPLLYAVSNSFKNSTRSGTLNSDTVGDFTVNSDTGVIAIVFAPGYPIGQSRTEATFTVSQYLESSNANGDTTFVNAAESSTFNDRLIWITPKAFFPALEMRAMRVARERLLHYFSITGRFPLSNRYLVDTSCWTYGGRLPYPTSGNPCLPAGNGASAEQWTMAWPTWFFSNYWDYVLHYAVAERCTSNSGTICDGSGNYLRVDGTDGTRALLIRQGINTGQTRPCTAVSQCLDDTENSDSDRDYITPVAGNDKLTIISP